MHKMSTNGRTIVQKFDNGTVVEYHVDDLPDIAQEYALMRGARKIISDVLAGFDGTTEQAIAACERKWTDLCNGVIRQSTAAIPTPDQLHTAMAALAPEADDGAIRERVREWHPDFAGDKKERAKRMKRLKERMVVPSLAEALTKAGFAVATPELSDLLEGLE